MKILVVCQHYWPEPYRLSDICEELVQRGHEVHVVTDIPNYPDGNIYDDYRNGKFRKQLHNGVNISRTFTIGRRNNKFFRLLNYYSYSISSTLYMNRLNDEYDVVLAYQSSPITMARAAAAYAKKHGKKALLYCLDLWPASLKAGGVNEKSLLHRFFHSVSKKIYRRFDFIAVSSPGFINYLKNEFNISASIAYLPQYADNRFNCVQRKREDVINILFAGNIGYAQNISTAIRAASYIEKNTSVKVIWHIAGMGSELESSRRLADELEVKSLIFYGYLEQQELKKLFSVADAMLLTFKSGEPFSLTLPLKLMSYLASEKPIIASADGAVAKIIQAAGCGYAAPAESPELLAQAVLDFASMDDHRELGHRALDYYLMHFSKQRFMDDLENILFILTSENKDEDTDN